MSTPPSTSPAPPPSAPTGAPPLFEVKRLTRTFSGGGGIFGKGHLVAVDDVSFALPAEPTIVTLVGESGSGKSTTARLMLGLDTPTSGEVCYQGQSIHAMSKPEWLKYRREVQAVFQDPYGIYNPFYRIDRVFETPIHNYGLVPEGRQVREVIEDALRAVDLRPGDVLGRYPHQLSGGERQRVMLARLYLMRPRVVVADEPVSMIDMALRTLFLNILLDFRANSGMSCLFITHNLATAYYLGGEIMVLCLGRMIERGSLDEVVKRPKHPYTQQLVESIPSPDPDRRWKTRLSGSVQAGADRAGSGPNRCIYAGRCPHVLDVCRRVRPQPIAVGPAHEVACHLYGPPAS